MPKLLAYSSLTLGCLVTVSCTFDPSQYRATGNGGSTALATSASSGPTYTSSSSEATAETTSTDGSTTSQSSTGATTSSAATSSSSSSSSSTSTGSGTPPLAPCGVPSDDFSKFPNFETGPGMWQTQDTVQFTETGETGAQATISNDSFAGAHLKPMAFNECYASVDIYGLSYSFSDGANPYLNLWIDGGHNTEINYSGVTFIINAGPHGNTGFVAGGQGVPVALGIAIHQGNIYYLYVPKGQTTWTHGTKKALDPWMSMNNIALGFGVNGKNGNWGKFQHFNTRAITTSDLW